MGDTMSETEWAKCVADMRKAGTAAGKAAATWLIDGNSTPEDVRRMLIGWDEGDPAAPSAPCPLSGEWADEPTLRDWVECETDADPDSLEPEELDELASAFEDAYAEAWQLEAERSARAFLGLDKGE